MSNPPTEDYVQFEHGWRLTGEAPRRKLTMFDDDGQSKAFIFEDDGTGMPSFPFITKLGELQQAERDRVVKAYLNAKARKAVQDFSQGKAKPVLIDDRPVGDGWRVFRQSPERVLIKFGDAGVILDYLFELDDPKRFGRLLRSIIDKDRGDGGKLTNMFLGEEEPDPVRPKITKTEDRAVITIRPASAADRPDFLIGPIETEFDAQVLVSILNEAKFRSWDDWEAVKTHTEVTETIL